MAVVIALFIFLYLFSALKRNTFDLFPGVTGVCIVSFIWLVINRFKSNISGKDILERKDEEIIISDREIKYVFRLRNQMRRSSRYVVTVVRGSENSIDFDDMDEKITFTGMCTCQNVEKYGTKYETVIDEKVLDEFVLYDYFEPSLIINLNKDRRN